ncbi:hypothetical protein [Dermatobacter hominis]|uniref:hypothetical protein n=1 Tax=Dermatobacter hominis TaxID=2884263 RepID=UPI001D0FD0A4|nr:hypothetical protein [Dermatobacter hominis]UDY34541.1 hypothetical protein LH044_14505 [Dermatobacter hominis]
MAMVMMKKSGVARAALAACAAAVVAVGVACAPEPAGPGGGGGTTTTTTTSTTIPFSQPTGGVWTNFTMACTAFTPVGNFPFNQSASVNVTAPPSAPQGSEFYMMVTPGPFIPPVEVSGYSLSSMVGMTIRFPLSPNMQLLDTVLSSSINAGSGMPSVKVEGTDLVYRVPGPFIPGQEIQMPQVRLQVKATGPVGSTIQTKLTSMSSVAIVGGIIEVPNSCTGPVGSFFNTTITPALP